jgi:hypothetical protein
VFGGRRLRFGLLQFELTLGSVGGLEDTRSHGWMGGWMDTTDYEWNRKRRMHALQDRKRMVLVLDGRVRRWAYSNR